MKPRSLLILTLLVVGLGAFVWFGRELPSTEERAAKAKRILRIEPDEVETLEIDWDGKSVAFVKQTAGQAKAGEEESEAEADEASEPSEWRLTKPVEARADSTAVEGLVRRLVNLEKERTLEDVSRADVGLAQPRARVHIGAGDDARVLEVGAEVPASSSMTLAIEGESPVYIVGSGVWTDLTKDPGDWRDKNLFTGQRGDIERINIASGGERVVLAKRGDEFWVESPLADRADQTAVNSLLSTLTGLRAERFVDSPSEKASMGLDPALATIEVVMAGRERPLRLSVGAEETAPAEAGTEPDDSAAAGESEAGSPLEDGPSTSVYLDVDGQIVTTLAQLAGPAARPVEAWRSKDLVSSDVYELARVDIEDATGSTELSRADSSWLRDGEPIEFGVATDLLYEISGGAAERAVESSAVALGEPVLTVRLVPEVEEGLDGAEPEILTLYPPQDGETPARVSGRDVVLMLSAETADKIRDKLAAVRSAPVERPADETESGASEGTPEGGEAPGTGD